jgi:hypothetical protein
MYLLSFGWSYCISHNKFGNGYQDSTNVVYVNCLSVSEASALKTSVIVMEAGEICPCSHETEYGGTGEKMKKCQGQAPLEKIWHILSCTCRERERIV